MPSQAKTIKYAEFDQGVKASYKLGLLDGRAEMRNQLEDMRQQLVNMLKTNKRLFQLMLEGQKEEKKIKITPCFTLNLLETLRKMQRFSQLHQLKKKYEEATGEVYKATRVRKI